MDIEHIRECAWMPDIDDNLLRADFEFEPYVITDLLNNLIGGDSQMQLNTSVDSFCANLCCDDRYTIFDVARILFFVTMGIKGFPKSLQALSIAMKDRNKFTNTAGYDDVWKDFCYRLNNWHIVKEPVFLNNVLSKIEDKSISSYAVSCAKKLKREVPMYRLFSPYELPLALRLSMMARIINKYDSYNVDADCWNPSDIDRFCGAADCDDLNFTQLCGSPGVWEYLMDVSANELDAFKLMCQDDPLEFWETMGDGI